MKSIFHNKYLLLHVGKYSYNTDEMSMVVLINDLI
ncbi:hypothetical protein PAU_01376 [Photorhabdus asymbiotica]|uniref:Uncharacterized protein n=1 Tax=Photorhabdus asymbiotica subsp. asymbiotica (strain ATCC 43949 / 3105-77) TaxID=553480 RepID=C7BSG5_PHOAA|nr:hypothetical protein PAU_01376 [Photorhabdus asymbiotica]